MASDPSADKYSLRTATQHALESNIAHQYALTKYAEKIAAEMEEMEDLMAALDTEDGAVDEDLEPSVQIPGAQRAAGPCPPFEFLNPLSPFYEDASRRSKYLSSITLHTMKAKETEVLADAVRRENERIRALKAQACGQSTTTFQFDVDNNTNGLDWDMVAEKVSAGSSTKRTAEECRIKWLGDRHPAVKHGEWLASELDKLKDLVEIHRDGGKIDWVNIARELGTGRTPIDCMRHGLLRKRHTWNPYHDQKLVEAVERHGIDNWAVVARSVSEDATAGQCQGRYFRALDPTLKKGNWTEEEDARLAAAAEAYGNAWVEVAATLPGRTNEHCRDRWQEKFSPNAKASSTRKKWTDEEDATLVQAVNDLGKKWKEISAKLGKTAFSCRQRHEKLIEADNERAGPSVQSAPEVDSTRPRSRLERKETIPTSGGEGESPVPPVSTKPRPKPRPKMKASVKGKEKAQGGTNKHSIGIFPADSPALLEGPGAAVTEHELAAPNPQTDMIMDINGHSLNSTLEPSPNIGDGGNNTIPDTVVASALSPQSADTREVTPVEAPMPTIPVPRRRGRPPKRLVTSISVAAASIDPGPEMAISTRARRKQATSALQSKAVIRPNERKRGIEQVVDSAPSGEEIPSKRRESTRSEPEARENLAHDGERADRPCAAGEIPVPATGSSTASMELPSLADAPLTEAIDRHSTSSLMGNPSAVTPKRKRGRPRGVGTMPGPAKTHSEIEMRRSTRISIRTPQGTTGGQTRVGDENM